ncbi:MAG: InlB B-repeat-containing protein [Erysipelotrichaceae bacterium]|jgi:hypothetical protein|nr:InlB B-repeat-containing protein [Erysipelotrichaceae bacterium]
MRSHKTLGVFLLLSLFACDVPIVIPSPHVVTFDKNYDTPERYVSVEVAHETQVSPITVLRDGFSLINWQLDGVVYDFETLVTSDITLVAIWSELFTVTFDQNYETEDRYFEVTVLSGETVAPIEVSRLDYRFTGWFLEEVLFDFETPINDHLTLVAHWEEDIKDEASMVHLYSMPEGVKRYEAARMYIEDQEADLYEVMVNTSHVYVNPIPERTASAAGIFKLRGRATITIKTNYEITRNINVLPSEYRIMPVCDVATKTITFEIYNPGQYVIEPNRDSNLAIHLFIDELKVDASGSEVNYYESLIENGDTIIRFPAGLHHKDNSSYIDSSGFISPNSNTTIILDYGAVVQAKIRATGKTNLKIIGGGILDGTTFSRNQGGNSVPINLRESTDLLLSGFAILDPGAWVTNLYYCTDFVIDNMKVISSRANGDGITLQSCQNGEIMNCFVRSFDDSLVVKNYTNPEGQWTNPSARRRASINLNFHDIILWTDLAQSMEIGYETAGEEINNIDFSNITVLHNFHKPIISIHNANDAYVHDITYQDITVEDASMGLGDAGLGENGYNSTSLIEITARSSSNYTHVLPIGDINDVSISNVLVKSTRTGLNLAVHIVGQQYMVMDDYYLSESYVNNVLINGVKIVNQILDQNYEYLITNDYVTNLEIINTLERISGSSVKRFMTNAELATLQGIRISVN